MTMLRKFISGVAVMFGALILVGSLGVSFIDWVGNIPGDGIAPRATLTSVLLGCERNAGCSLEEGQDTRTGRAWSCSIIPDVWCADESNREIREVVATLMFSPFEWLIAVIIMITGIGWKRTKEFFR